METNPRPTPQVAEAALREAETAQASLANPAVPGSCFPVPAVLVAGIALIQLLPHLAAFPPGLALAGGILGKSAP